MKPFNLAEAKAGRPVVLIDSQGGVRPARIICWDRKNDDCPLVVLSSYPDRELIKSFSTTGVSGGGHSMLMHPTEKKSGWVMMYRHRCLGSQVHDTKKEAEDYGRFLDGTAVEIHWEE